MPSTDRMIHLVFKTHLDIGFTDHAEKVRRQYHERFIPQAIDTALHFHRENPERPAFIWTTGSWLIHDHLATQPGPAVERLEKAIALGLVRWHALPFTTHSELMSPALFRAGLSYAAELDQRFGVKTIAAKMTDVPGHTRGIVPLLAAAGVRFLHIGVNTASPPPDVPDVFRWRAPDGAEIVVMYQRSYGATHFPDGLGDGLSFAHTSDNIGPQSVSQTAEVYRQLAHDYPGVAIRAATLDDYAGLLWARRADFPVIDFELGDNWIHGVASDPLKTQKFLALQRLYDRFAASGPTPQQLGFGRRLAMVAEHTWGVDIKTFLRDEEAWDREAFEAARATDFRFAYTEASWAEQRAYLDAAQQELGDEDRAAARSALAATTPPPPATTTPPGEKTTLEIGGWRIGYDFATGDLTSLTNPAGTTITGRNGTLLGFRHESYDAADMARHRDSYLTHRAEWAILDHDKPGLAAARTARSARWAPVLVGVGGDGDTAMLTAAMPEQAADKLGAPARVDILVRPRDGTQLELAVVLRSKPANRMPEAGFVSWTPTVAGNWEYLKMGLWQRGDRIAESGGGQLQAVAGVRARLADGPVLLLTPEDTPLVAPFSNDFMRYDRTTPDLSAGLRFNLYNNKWGTNFTMWWEGDLLARYRLSLLDSGEL